MNKKYINQKIQRLNNNSVLVTLANKEYLQQAKQLFSSAYWNAGWCGDYLLLAHEIPEYDLKWFREKGIKIYKCKPLWKKDIYGHMYSVVLSKFYLFKPYFKKWKTVIFVDSDAIIKASIEKLTDKQSAPGFSAVTDDYVTLGQDFHTKAYKELSEKYDIHTESFNSGVIVLNTRIIDKNAFNSLKASISKYKSKISMEDQSLLNIYFYKKWKKLSRPYNMLVNLTYANYNLDTTEVKGIIIHCAHAPKPWEKESIFYAEWKKSLALAEKMDLKNIRAPSRIWSNKELIVYDAYLKTRFILAKTHNQIFIQTPIMMREQIGKLNIFIRQIVYKIGRLIKKLSPRLYYKLGGKN
jgi:lipopolysaccharide biosynthesis glycosyltransferase